jgi:hypothetical protein
MSILDYLPRRRGVIIAAVVAAAGTYMMMPPGPLDAQQSMPPTEVESSPAPVSGYQSHSSEQEHAHSDTTHVYTSQATRANDALVITAVKSALSDDGVTTGHAVVVDCDHGVVTLTGAVASRDDAQHAAQVASSIDGVRHVNNKLAW